MSGVGMGWALAVAVGQLRSRLMASLANEFRSAWSALAGHGIGCSPGASVHCCIGASLLGSRQTHQEDSQSLRGRCSAANNLINIALSLHVMGRGKVVSRLRLAAGGSGSGGICVVVACLERWRRCSSVQFSEERGRWLHMLAGARHPFLRQRL